MPDIKVYQIGVGNFGQYGFAKLIDIHNHFKTVDVEFSGVVEPDRKKRTTVEKRARAKGIELEVFETTNDMYKSASEKDEQVLVYDSGPTDNHSENICKSMIHGFNHLAEKPSSVTRNQHTKARRLEENNNAIWMINFIEMENPVVKKAIQLLQNKRIENIEVFRENKVGVLKAVHPTRRLGVQGGDILDKMYHELFVLSFLKAAGEKIDFKLRNVSNKCWTLKEIISNSIETMCNGKADGANPWSTVTQTTAVFSNYNIEVRLHSSWGGISNECRRALDKHESILGQPISNFRLKKNANHYLSDEEARFFIVKGQENLLGDMLNNRLYNLNEGTTIEVPKLGTDMLYRIIRKAILKAAGKQTERIITEKETDVFINAIFDANDMILKEKLKSNSVLHL